MPVNSLQNLAVLFTGEILQDFQGVEEYGNPEPAFHRRKVMGTGRERVLADPFEKGLLRLPAGLQPVLAAPIQIGRKEKHGDMLEPGRFPDHADVGSARSEFKVGKEYAARFLLEPVNDLLLAINGEDLPVQEHVQNLPVNMALKMGELKAMKSHLVDFGDLRQDPLKAGIVFQSEDEIGLLGPVDQFREGCRSKPQ